MGFRTGAYATVWKVQPASDTRTTLQLSVSRKDKQSGEYVTDFSGFVDAVGTAAAKKASMLKERARIKLGDCDVSTNYVKDKNITYTNFKLFSFDDAEESSGQSDSQGSQGYANYSIPSKSVDDGEVEGGAVDDSEEVLPF